MLYYSILTYICFVCILHTEMFFSSVKKKCTCSFPFCTAQPTRSAFPFFTFDGDSDITKILFSFFQARIQNTYKGKWQLTLSLSVGETTGTSRGFEQGNVLSKSGACGKLDTTYPAVNLNSQALIMPFRNVDSVLPDLQFKTVLKLIF